MPPPYSYDDIRVSIDGVEMPVRDAAIDYRQAIAERNAERHSEIVEAAVRAVLSHHNGTLLNRRGIESIFHDLASGLGINIRLHDSVRDGYDMTLRLYVGADRSVAEIIERVLRQMMPAWARVDVEHDEGAPLTYYPASESWPYGMTAGFRPHSVESIAQRIAGRSETSPAYGYDRRPSAPAVGVVEGFEGDLVRVRVGGSIEKPPVKPRVRTIWERLKVA